MMAPRFTCWNEREATTRNLPAAWSGEIIVLSPSPPAYPTGAPANPRGAPPEPPEAPAATRHAREPPGPAPADAGVHDRRAVERASRAAGVTRHKVVPDPKRGAVDRNRRRGIELPFDGRQLLEA